MRLDGYHVSSGSGAQCVNIPTNRASREAVSWPLVPVPRPDRSFVVPEDLHARPLDGVVRVLSQVPWSEARRLVETGKVRIAGEVVTDPARKVRAGDRLALFMRAPRPQTARVQELGADLVVYADPALVVVRKPAGMSTVPF